MAACVISAVKIYINNKQVKGKHWHQFMLMFMMIMQGLQQQCQCQYTSATKWQQMRFQNSATKSNKLYPIL